MGLQELRADAKLLRERLVDLPPDKLDVKNELTENVIPLIECMLEALQDGVEADVADLGAAVDELIDQSGDVLQPETATKLVAVLEVGKLLANELDAAAAKLDDVSKKRVRQIIKAYRQGFEVATAIITEITLVDDDDDDDDDEDELKVSPDLSEQDQDDADDDDDDVEEG